MKKMGLTVGVVMVAVLITAATEADAQLKHRAGHSHAGHSHAGLGGGNSANRVPVYYGTDADGMTLTAYPDRVNVLRSMKMTSHNLHYSPHPCYTYSNAGLSAGRTHTWNQNQSAQRPWHGEYMNWRWREPTALVVPPTAAYQTSYAWGVGQTRSRPIYHQFSRQSAGVGGIGGGNYSPTPYWPSSTEQFGLYPVRAPW